MAGIYIHIPFCKQACIYCDFHFSTSLNKKGELVAALCKELGMKKDRLSEEVATVYLGGGTPSLLSEDELDAVLRTVYAHYRISERAEITLEANPDDLSADKIKTLKKAGINRLSIGVQSFFDDALRWMNRSHNAEQAMESLLSAKAHFDNISMDLIYGVPGMDNQKWVENLEIFIALGLPHLSAYALTVEPKTVLANRIKKKKTKPVDEAKAREQYGLLVDRMTEAGYVNYEFSNFGKPGYFSKNNTAYWTGKPYLGIGPSAHGFDGARRFWNVRSNSAYIQSIENGTLPQKMETLSTADRYNEYIMTHLRTMWGVSLEGIQQQFGGKFACYFEKEAEKLFENGFLETIDKNIHISKKGKFLGDGISAELFFVES